MSRVSRRIAAVAAVASVLVSLVSVASAAPQPGSTCKVAGRERVTSAGTLRCTASSGSSLRWVQVAASVAATTTTTTTSSTTTTTTTSARAPQVSAISADDSRVRFTLSGMSPDTGNYAVQWVTKGQSFNTYRMLRVTDKNVSISTAEFACGRPTLTFRVYVMRADWQLADGHQTQNVTPHSEPFDITLTHACPTTTTTTTTVPLTCAQGGTCVVGDTGPGGGIVFYVHSDADNMFTSDGSDCGTTCRYIEAAPSDQSTTANGATTAASCFTSGSNAGLTSCQTASVIAGSLDQPSTRTYTEEIGRGMSATNLIYSRLTGAGSAATSAYAAGVAWTYSNNGKTDWFLPSKNELNELCKYARQQTTGDSSVTCSSSGTLRSGFSSSVEYWSSSEGALNTFDAQGFVLGNQGNGNKATDTGAVRPVRAFGTATSCALGGTCAVGDTGPGGGIVFYVASSAFASTGSDCGTSCRYLEVAPVYQSFGLPYITNVVKCYASGSDTADQGCGSASIFANSDNQSSSRTNGLTVGGGMSNTNKVYGRATTAGGEATSAYASGAAWGYTNNGKSDWHLPSKDELNELCKFARTQTTGDTSVVCAATGTVRLMFAGNIHWSSSEFLDGQNAWRQDFDDGNQGERHKALNTYLVRAVRAFG